MVHPKRNKQIKIQLPSKALKTKCRDIPKKKQYP